MTESSPPEIPLLDDVLVDGATARERDLLWATEGRPASPLRDRILARIEDAEALWPQELHDRLLDLIQDAIHQAVDTRRSDVDELLRARMYQLIRSLDEDRDDG